METSNSTITPVAVNTTNAIPKSGEVFSLSSNQGLPVEIENTAGAEALQDVEGDVMATVVEEGTPKAGLEVLASEEKMSRKEQLGEMSSLMSDIKEVADKDSYLKNQIRDLEYQLAKKDAQLEQNKELLMLLKKFIEELRKKEENKGILGVLLQMIIDIIKLTFPTDEGKSSSQVAGI